VTSCGLTDTPCNKNTALKFMRVRRRKWCRRSVSAITPPIRTRRYFQHLPLCTGTSAISAYPLAKTPKCFYLNWRKKHAAIWVSFPRRWDKQTHCYGRSLVFQSKENSITGWNSRLWTSYYTADQKQIFKGSTYEFLSCTQKCFYEEIIDFTLMIN